MFYRHLKIIPVLLAALLFVFCGANSFAQNTNASDVSANETNTNDTNRGADGNSPVAGSVPGGVNVGSASDAGMWRKIRHGDEFRTTGGNKNAAVMIQSGGQDWRLVRNGPLPMYAAWAIFGMVILLSLFFAIRGRIKIGHGGPTGLTLTRFSLSERVAHWLLASSFIVLALTGLNLIFGSSILMPLIGKPAFATLTATGKFTHNYVGFAFLFALILVVVLWLIQNFPNRNDLRWLLRGGGLIGKDHPPADKFNAGQKIFFWLVVLCGISLFVSGWALMNPFTTHMFSSTFGFFNNVFGTSYPTDLSPVAEQQYQSLWHSIMAIFMIAVIMAHIYIGTIGMQGALSAMTEGEVDTNWAMEHHSVWAEKEMKAEHDNPASGDALQPAE